MARGVNHVVGQVEEFVGKVGDRLAFFVKDAFSVLCDVGHMGEEAGVGICSGKPRTPKCSLVLLKHIEQKCLQNRGG